MNFYSIIPYAVCLFHKYYYMELNMLKSKGQGRSLEGSKSVSLKTENCSPSKAW